jgi:hypothetical protein
MHKRSIPMWVVKAKAIEYYVNHVDMDSVLVSTKRDSDNPSTKGSLKFKVS